MYRENEFLVGPHTVDGQDARAPTVETLPAKYSALNVSMNIENQLELQSYLRDNGHIASNEEPTIQPLAGGVSNRTVLVTRATGEAWVIKQALAKLRVAVDWFSSPERVHREALGLQWINKLAPQSTPTLIFEDHEHHLIGMAAIPQPHENWKTLLLAGDLQLDHVEQFAHLLATIHATSYERRAELAPLFADRTFFESLRLEPYYDFAAQQVPEATAFLQTLIKQTRPRALTLVHGDYSPKNVLVHNGKLLLLDHEVIHFGDPAFDLGFSLTHLLSKANHNLDTQPDLADQFQHAASHYWHEYSRTLSGNGKNDDENTADLFGLAELDSTTIRHTLACLLARIDGRSPLEYLSDAARTRQRNAVLSLIAKRPIDVEELITEFVAMVKDPSRSPTF